MGNYSLNFAREIGFAKSLYSDLRGPAIDVLCRDTSDIDANARSWTSDGYLIHTGFFGFVEPRCCTQPIDKRGCVRANQKFIPPISRSPSDLEQFRLRRVKEAQSQLWNSPKLRRPPRRASSLT